jgi:hypothetical protein
MRHAARGRALSDEGDARDFRRADWQAAFPRDHVG